MSYRPKKEMMKIFGQRSSRVRVNRVRVRDCVRIRHMLESLAYRLHDKRLAENANQKIN